MHKKWAVMQHPGVLGEFESLELPSHCFVFIYSTVVPSFKYSRFLLALVSIQHTQFLEDFTTYKSNHDMLLAMLGTHFHEATKKASVNQYAQNANQNPLLGPLLKIKVDERRNVVSSRLITKFQDLNCHTSYTTTKKYFLSILVFIKTFNEFSNPIIPN